jgi:hypothetical protein
MLTWLPGKGPSELGILMRGTAMNPVISALSDTRQQLRRKLRDPFRPEAGRVLIVHCSHHKVGTVWFNRILGAVAKNYGMHFEFVARELPAATTDVFHFSNSRFDRAVLGGRPFRGTHIVRDPRDIAVSGYHYHLRTDEPWTRKPRDEWGGKSYQEHLQSLSPHDGLLAEITRCARAEWRTMGAWDYEQPEFLEVRYEDLLSDESTSLEKMFRHYGFRNKDCLTSVRIAHEFSLDTMRSRKDAHVRSGHPGEWRKAFEGEHIARFKELTGDLIVKLGYENTPDW